MTETPKNPDRIEALAGGLAQTRAGELVARDATSEVIPTRRWSRSVATLRTHLPQPVQHPAMAATAAVGAGLAASVIREAVKSEARRRKGTAEPVVVGAFVFHHVYVVHHIDCPAPPTRPHQNDRRRS